MSICKGNNETYLITSRNNKEINKLKELGLPIYFYDYPEGYYDEVGGYHDCAEGWNPNGVWCGECTNKSCADCSLRHIKEAPDGSHYQHAEECLNCEHKSLCFFFLEWAGLITYPNKKIMEHMCDDIKKYPLVYYEDRKKKQEYHNYICKNGGILR